ncbi:MAG: HD domain-containing phosphohydrolase [Solirubrobacterales bacterium]
MVDDEPPVRRTLSRALSADGYECATAEDVGSARQMLEENRYDLVICDLNMPGESGMALLEELNRSHGEVAVLMATGEDDPAIAHSASVRGADGYLIKPFTRNELLIHVDSALEQARRRQDQVRVSERSLADAHERATEVREALMEVAEREVSIDRQRAEMLSRLSEAVGQRDLETGAHIRRIGRHAGLLARAHGLEEETVRAVGLAAPMHDVGKVAIPDSILLKPGSLSSGERDVMKRHTQIGHDILAYSGSPLLDLAAEIALTHHERFDGGGYPSGLAGEGIPLSGRIVAIADVFDALVSDRPYRPRMPMESALGIMHEGRGAHFDPNLFDCFIDNLEAVLEVSGTMQDPRR